MKRAIIILIILTVVIGIGVAGYLLLTPKTYSITEDPDIETLTVATDTIVAAVNAAGKLEAIDSVNLNFEVPGVVDKIRVSEGSRVEAGVLLAKLDTVDLERAVQLANIDFSRAEAQLQKLLDSATEADIAAAQASLDSAKANLENLLQGPAEADVKAAQAALNSAQANLQRILDGPNANSVTAAAAGVRKAQIALRQAQDAYDQVAYDSRAASAQGLMLEQATIDYETALANYNLAVKDAENADILAAESQVAQAEASLQKLLDSPNQAQVQAAQAQVTQAESALQKLLDGASDADIAVAQAAVDSAKLNLDKAQDNLDKAYLTSPIAGTVTTINITEGETPVKQPAIILADLSAFKLEVDIDEIDINRIAPGQSAIITLDSLPDEEFPGYVDTVAVAPTVGASGGIVAYAVTVLVDSKDAPFKIGMNVNVTIETDRLEDVVVIENRAVQIDRETGQAFVDKVEGDAIVRTEIILGQRGSRVSQVISGLEAGDIIAIQQKSRRDQLRQVIGGGSD